MRKPAKMQVVELRASWPKGYARLGAAFFALEHFGEVCGGSSTQASALA